MDHATGTCTHQREHKVALVPEAQAGLRFWLVPPRRRADRRGALQRPGSWHLRVLLAVPGAGKRRQIGSCRLPPGKHGAAFLDLCRERLLLHGASTSTLEACMAQITSRLVHEGLKILRAQIAARKRR